MLSDGGENQVNTVYGNMHKKRWKKFTAVVTKNRRLRMPFGPILESKIAAKACKDLIPFLLCIAGRTSWSLTLFWLKLSSFSLEVMWFKESCELRDIRLWRDCMYAKVPPATNTAETAANVLLLVTASKHWWGFSYRVFMTDNVKTNTYRLLD